MHFSILYSNNLDAARNKRLVFFFFFFWLFHHFLLYFHGNEDLVVEPYLTTRIRRLPLARLGHRTFMHMLTIAFH